MPFLIGDACVDVKDKTCITVCPVDCIYEGDRKLYIHPDECVDCGACEPECPVTAIYIVDDVPDELTWAIDDNTRFFSEPLPGRSTPLGSPGGAATIGPIGTDTPYIAGLPRNDR
ncbi:NAD-dependent dihydropyrimidine dehydrogenase, PreA subunit [Thermomonospora echinospora]|uniref:Ferredoxin n=1 Tax=Thermomonospora echinospora TaxID=1992 RepID=A0A1H6E686_9ACTN|nr:ferredoxin [Thermomonospora echinospora]SEG92763.1 NAD-dependent dihydropyrimidine dehydrogenase, PreA subunit [Thermomonospora echinospora]